MATLGPTSPGASTFADGGDSITLLKVTMPSGGGTATKISTYYAGGTGDNGFRGVLYADSSGSPGALLAVTDEKIVTASAAAQWWDTPAISTAISAGAFWYGIWVHNGGNPTGYYDTSGGIRAYRTSGVIYSSSSNPVDPFGTPTGTDSNLNSIYVTYTPGVVSSFPYPRTSRRPMPMLRGPDRDRIGKLTLR